MKLIALIVMLMSFPALATLTHESEVAILKSGGNTQLDAYFGKTSNKYNFNEKNLLGFGGHYTYGESADAITGRNWDVNSKFEHLVSEHVALTLGEVIEGDKFQGIKTRYNSDLGVKYYFIKSDKKNLFSEVGYRYTIEDRYEPEENAYEHKARLYNEYNHKYSETLQWKFWLEYIPNFTDSTDYLVTGEASMTTILTSIFSLKVAYKGIYDDKPAIPGNKNYDYITTTSLVAKF